MSKYPANRQRLSPGMTEKYCYGPSHPEGRALLPIDAFATESRRSDGKMPRCRECMGMQRKNQQRNPVPQQKWYSKNRQRALASAQRILERLRAQTIAAYGGRCQCCGEDERGFLTIDHVGGREERHVKQEQALSGVQMYRWLRNNGYPKEGFRLLCMNCNWATRYGKTCPHQRTRKEMAS